MLCESISMKAPAAADFHLTNNLFLAIMCSSCIHVLSKCIFIFHRWKVESNDSKKRWTLYQKWNEIWLRVDNCSVKIEMFNQYYFVMPIKFKHVSF